MTLIQFTRNYNDLSTDRGFQYEFFCDRCGNGYQTEFQTSASGNIVSALDAAGGLLGGLFSNAADLANHAHSVAWEKAHDAAFAAAVEEARPHFHKCKRCGKWVDDDCWNDERVLCKDCAPALEEELSVVQMEATVQKAREKAYETVEVNAEQFKKTIVAACPHCGAKVMAGKFCPECGKPLAAKKFCSECGKEVPAGVKFCPECGAGQN
ncbi:MAG: zinc-ribbon domain-containing protein [Anaerolineales bacterium]|nr:zinc-ribbon domain-containing protein [Anaerolineales bacterium]